MLAPNHVENKDILIDQSFSLGKDVRNQLDGEDGILDHASLNDLPNHANDKDITEHQGKQGHEPLGTQDANNMKGSDTGPKQEIEANGITPYHEQKL